MIFIKVKVFGETIFLANNYKINNVLWKECWAAKIPIHSQGEYHENVDSEWMSSHTKLKRSKNDHIFQKVQLSFLEDRLNSLVMSSVDLQKTGS